MASYVKPTFIVGNTEELEAIDIEPNQVLLDYLTNTLYVDTDSKRNEVPRITDLAKDVVGYYLPLTGGTLTGAVYGPRFIAKYGDGTSEPSFRLMRTYNSKTIWSKIYLQNSADANIAFAFDTDFNSSTNENGNATYSIVMGPTGIYPYSTGKFYCGTSNNKWSIMYSNSVVTANANGYYTQNTSNNNVKIAYMSSSDIVGLGNGSYTLYLNCSACGINGNFYPRNSTSTPEYTLGTSSKRWKNVYTYEINVTTLTIDYQLTINANSSSAGVSGGAAAIITYGDIDPYDEDKCDLGSANNYWKCVYTNNVKYYDSCSKSDRREKQNIVDLDTDKCIKLIMGLNPVEYEYIKYPSISHYGFIAQDVRDVEYSINNELVITSAEYENEEPLNYDPSDYNEDEVSWNLNYEGLIAPMVKTIQELVNEVNALKEEIKALKEK